MTDRTKDHVNTLKRTFHLEGLSALSGNYNDASTNAIEREYYIKSLDGDIGFTDEKNTLLERSNMFQRVTTSTTLVAGQPNRRIDVFPANDSVEITLPDVTLGTFGSFDIFNQTDREYNVTVKDHLGTVLKVIPPVNGYSFYFDTEASPQVAPWEAVHIDGRMVPILDVADFGDFNSLNYNDLTAPEFIVTGTGSQFSNLPPGFTLLPAANYSFYFTMANYTGFFMQQVIMTTDSDFSNSAVGRTATRAASNFAGAASVGWKVVSLVGDP